MEDVAAPKKSTTLSVDRAAFLLLRVKKAFKKKRHHRKEKPTQLTGGTLTAQRSCRKAPPPLMRSRTLPAIIVPGIPVVSLHTEKNYGQLLDERIDFNTNFNRRSLLPKNVGASTNSKSLKLPNEDTPLVYRRKSSGNSTTCNNNNQQLQHEQLQQQRYDASLIQTSEGLECHPDGSVLLRIPAPHVVAARAYRLSSTAAKRHSEAHAHTQAQQPIMPSHETTLITNSTTTSGGGNVANSSSGSISTLTTNTTALTRLVKLLHQSSTSKTAHSDYIFPSPLAPNGEEAPRRLSWERRKDSSALQRSASIDSVAEAVWSDTPRPSLDIPRPVVAPFSKRPSASSLFSNCSSSSQNAQLNINYSEISGGGSTGNSRRESLLSPSSTRRNKLTRILNDNVLPNNSNIGTQKPSSSSSSHNISLSDNDDNNNDDDVIIRPSSKHRYYNSPVHQHNSNNHSTNIKSPQRLHRWSVEQLTTNKNNAEPVARPLRRTAISYAPADLKEMEFLIPNVPSLSTSAVTESQLHSLSISRHSATASTSSSSRVPSYLRMSHPKNAKLNAAQTAACSDENTDDNSQTLSIYRQPASARSKGGNTPHRSKMSKKQLKLAQAQMDKFTQINVHLHALFSAVEHGHLDKARTILESTDLDVNSINSDGLSALDVAVLSNNRSMTKMLLQHGAMEGSQFATDSIGTKLNALLKDAESRIHDLSGSSDGTCQPTFAPRASFSSIIIGNTSSSVTGCTGNEIDKQIGIWERRVKGLRRMLLGWDQARPPDAPASVIVDVTGENSITVQILEPFDGAIGTKFKVQWSTRADFGNVVGERELVDWTSFHGTMGAQCHINGLTQGRRYFVRATCGNVKGCGPYKTSVPASVVPSSWRDLNNLEDRYLGRQRLLDNLFTAVRLARPADVSELSLESTPAQRRNPKKKTTIKQLFSVASRFQKNLRRGIYFNCIIYCEDKVLVTSEDFLPVIEIDETYPSTLHSDYHWLMKVACTWEDVKSLRSDMERNLTSASHFRTKLLSAICQMQSALGLTDLGQLFYKPLRDSHGTVVLSCVQTVKSQKTVSILNSRWLPLNKLQKKIVALHEDYNITEMLISSVAEQIHYHQTSMQRLSAGLYLGYLKMQCSVEQIEVVVPAKTPNVLPHFKVRDNSHVTAEEWQVLKRSSSTAESKAQRLSLDFNANSEETTEVQRLFLYDLATAALKLLAYMNIKSVDASAHRLYDVEIIEHSKDISFLVICPAVELTCAAPGQSELLLQRDDLVSLSIQAFEMIHLRTYQSGIIQKYARLSCILELDTTLANHSHREAFSTSELQTAKDRLAKLHELTASLNAVWKSVRWLMDVIAFARDKNAQPAVAMQDILEFAQTSDELLQSNDKKQLLQLPIREVKFTKSGSGRGSWPGPARSPTATLAAEHSKSEQNLGINALSPRSVSVVSTNCSDPLKTQAATAEPLQTQHLQVATELTRSDNTLRKNSGDSVTSEYTSHSFYSTADSAVCSNNDLGTIFHSIPPSRSDDMLTLATAESLKKSTHRKRTSSNLTSSVSTSQTPIISISTSVPHLATKTTMIGSNLSLKAEDQTKLKPQSSHVETLKNHPSIVKPKAASSMNLHDGGLYLRTTLSALQTEMKVTTVITEDAQKNTVKGSSSASSSKNISRQSSEEDTASASSVTTADQQASGIIQVYTAYNTGLASGTSLKLHVTPKTSAREVINLVVKQLNMAAVLKGNNGPIYTSDMLDNFCLVAVIGARERCLRDDFKPLQLQNPWKKGRLYVRQKHELLAAIEHSNRKSQLI